MATAQERLHQLLPSLKDLLTQGALDGSLVAAAEEAWSELDPAVRERRLTRLASVLPKWTKGNLQTVPSIQALPAATLKGARGSYQESSDVILVNEEWVAGASAEQVLSVITAELGKALDAQVGGQETAAAPSAAQQRLNEILPSWYALLTQWSKDGSLVRAANEALKLDGPNAKPQSKGLLQSYVSQWSGRNFANLPEIVLLSDTDISSAQGAYAASTGKIYINAGWILTASEQSIQMVLTEELGHALDARLNRADTSGDEGEFFARVLIDKRGFAYMEQQLVLQEDDSGAVTIASNVVSVENANFPLYVLYKSPSSSIQPSTSATLWENAIGTQWSDTIVGSSGDDIYRATNYATGAIHAATNGLDITDFIGNSFVSASSYNWPFGPNGAILNSKFNFGDGYVNILTTGYSGNYVYGLVGSEISMGSGDSDINIIIDGSAYYSCSGFSGKINAGAGSDVLNVYLGYIGDANTAIGSASIDMGDGDDVVSSYTYAYSYNSSWVSRALVNSNITMGDGDDLVDLYCTYFYAISDSIIDMGAGGDRVILSGISSNSYINFGEGVDELILKDTSLDYVVARQSNGSWRITKSSDLQYSLVVTGLEKIIFDDRTRDLNLSFFTSPSYLYGNSLYKITQGLNWLESQAYSRAYGGDLATINNSNENTWLFNNLPLSYEVNIGLSRSYYPLDGGYYSYNFDWAWSDGTLIEYTNWNRQTTYPFSSEATNLSFLGELYGVLQFLGAPNPSTWYSAGGGYTQSISEYTLNLSVETTGAVEGQGGFSTILNLSAGRQFRHDIVDGATVYWSITGIDGSDLLAGQISGEGIISNGKLVLNHSLKADGVVENESFNVSVYSDRDRQIQIGATTSFQVVDSGTSPSVDLGFYGNSLYVSVAGPSWQEAQSNALKLGGNLTTINSFGENTYLANWLSSFGTNLYIGYTRNSQGNWEWVDQDASAFTQWRTQVDGGWPEPNNYWGDENVAMMYLDGSWNGFWNDINETGVNGYGIRQVTDGLAEIPFIRRGDSAYVIVQGPTWEEAEARAVSLGGHLATINDSAENDFIKQTFASGSDLSLYIGLYQDSTGNWVWADNFAGEGFKNWYPGQPSPGESIAEFILKDLGWYQSLKPMGYLNNVPNPSPYAYRGLAEIKIPANYVYPGGFDSSLANVLVVTGQSIGTIDGVAFDSTNVFDLGLGADTAILADTVASSVQMTIAGGDGIDSLYGNSLDNILILTGVNEGTLDGVAFSGFENVYLGAGNDKVYIKPGGRLTGLLDGGGGDPTPIILDPPTNPGGGTGGGGGGSGVSIPLPYVPPGSSVDGGNNSIYLNDDPNVLTLTGPGAGVVDGTPFTNFYAIEMRGGNDQAFINVNGSLAGVLDGGADLDSLTLNGADNLLSLDGLGKGIAAGTSITGFEIFDLSAGNDTATLDLSASTTPVIPGPVISIDGGADSDQLKLILSAEEVANLTVTGQIAGLRNYLANPTGQSITVNFLAGTYTFTGFESGGGLPEPPQISIAVSPDSVLEDGSINLVYTFTRTGPVTSELIVNYLIGGTADPSSDYTGLDPLLASRTIIFAAGSSTATLTVDPTADTVVEEDESVVVSLLNGDGYTLGDTTSATGTILNDDQPVISVTVSPARVSESGAANLIYTFTRTGPTSKALTVSYDVFGTATLGSDYTGIPTTAGTKTITFAVGSSTATLTVDPTPDTLVEADESVVVSLVSGSGYVLGALSSATGIIDSTAPTLVGVQVQGNSIFLRFSEDVTATAVPVSRFKVESLDSTGKATLRTLTNVNLVGPSDPSRVILTLSGTAPPSTVGMRISYVDPVGDDITGVIQDVSGNDLASFSNVSADTYVSANNATLASQYRNLILTGTQNASGTGNASANIMVGNDGNNVLDGLTGNDTATGGLGADTFAFSTVANSATNRDVITDFVSGIDKIQVKRSAYPGLSGSTLTTGQFAAGAGLIAATTTQQRFLYDTNTGILSFDRDGSGTAYGAVQMAVLGAGTALTRTDFVLVA